MSPLDEDEDERVIENFGTPPRLGITAGLFAAAGVVAVVVLVVAIIAVTLALAGFAAHMAGAP